MADKKISALPAATLPLAGTEILPMVQAGTTSQASVANLQAAPVAAGVAYSITYLNASKVPSWSANLTFDGTTLTVGTNTRINGAVGINRAPTSQFGLYIGSPITGGTDAQGIVFDGTVQSGVTGTAATFASNTQVVNSAFTLTSLIGYLAQGPGTFGLATVTNNYGFYASSTIAGGTNNFGFHSNLTSGTNKFNFYAAGTAANWFSGDVLVFGAGGLGYTTGSGGAVTQTTSRTTAVTLNKTNGAITLVSAAGSTTFQTFTVNNTTVAVTDVIHVSQRFGADKYAIWVSRVAANAFDITFATLSGTTTEQPIFNFAVIKAVNA